MVIFTLLLSILKARPSYISALSSLMSMGSTGIFLTISVDSKLRDGALACIYRLATSPAVNMFDSANWR